jgi:hypothetical protein
MSLFGKITSGLKNIANKVTGGYGEVVLTLEKDQYSPGDTVKGKVKVTAIEALKITKITAKLSGLERGQYSETYDPDHHERLVADGSGRYHDSFHHIQATASIHEKTHEHEVDLCGEAELEAGQVEEYDFVFSLPADLPVSYQGKHLSHVTTISVEVDIPWGVDLRTSQVLNVVSDPKAQSGGDTLKTAQQNLVCQAILTVAPVSLYPGDKLQWALRLAPSQPFTVRTVAVGLRSAEVLRARLSHRGPDPNPSSENQDDTSRSEPATIEIRSEEREIEILLERRSEERLVGQHLSSETVLRGDAQIPEDFAMGYQGRQGRHRVSLVVVVEPENGDPLIFRQDLAVHSRGDRIEFKVGTPEVLKAKDPEVGYIDFRVRGEVAILPSSPEGKARLVDRTALESILRPLIVAAIARTAVSTFSSVSDLKKTEVALVEAAHSAIDAALAEQGFKLADPPVLTVILSEALQDMLRERAKQGALGRSWGSFADFRSHYESLQPNYDAQVGTLLLPQEDAFNIKDAEAGWLQIEVIADWTLQPTLEDIRSKLAGDYAESEINSLRRSLKAAMTEVIEKGAVSFSELRDAPSQLAEHFQAAARPAMAEAGYELLSFRCREAKLARHFQHHFDHLISQGYPVPRGLAPAGYEATQVPPPGYTVTSPGEDPTASSGYPPAASGYPPAASGNPPAPGGYPPATGG